MTFDSEFVYRAIPYLVLAWAFGFGFGWVYSLIRTTYSGWVN